MDRFLRLPVLLFFKRSAAGTRGTAHYQPGVQQQGADDNTVHQAGQSIVAAFPELRSFLADGGHGRRSVSTHGQIVEADYADIRRNAQAELLALDHGGIGQQVMTADEAGDSHIQQAGKVAFQALGDIVGASGLRRAGGSHRLWQSGAAAYGCGTDRQSF